MNTLELRVGNYATCDHYTKGDYGVVRGIEQGVTLDYNWFGKKEIIPLALTDKWLEKLDFFFTLGTNEFERNGVIVYQKGKRFYYKPSNNLKPVELKYVHHIQNLYFILMGKNLVVKERK